MLLKKKIKAKTHTQKKKTHTKIILLSNQALLWWRKIGEMQERAQNIYLIITVCLASLSSVPLFWISLRQAWPRVSSTATLPEAQRTVSMIMQMIKDCKWKNFLTWLEEENKLLKIYLTQRRKFKLQDQKQHFLAWRCWWESSPHVSYLYSQDFRHTSLPVRTGVLKQKSKETVLHLVLQSALLKNQSLRHNREHGCPIINMTTDLQSHFTSVWIVDLEPLLYIHEHTVSLKVIFFTSIYLFICSCEINFILHFMAPSQHYDPSDLAPYTLSS